MLARIVPLTCTVPPTELSRAPPVPPSRAVLPDTVTLVSVALAEASLAEMVEPVTCKS